MNAENSQNTKPTRQAHFSSNKDLIPKQTSFWKASSIHWVLFYMNTNFSRHANITEVLFSLYIGFPKKKSQKEQLHPTVLTFPLRNYLGSNCLAIITLPYTMLPDTLEITNYARWRYSITRFMHETRDESRILDKEGFVVPYGSCCTVGEREYHLSLPLDFNNKYRVR